MPRSFCLSLPWPTAGTNPSMPDWSAPSAASCWIKHAHHTLLLLLFATCKSQPPCLFRASRSPLFSTSPAPLSQHYSLFPLFIFCLCSSSSHSAFPSPFSLSLLFPSLPPSLFHLIALILPGDRLWTELFPLSHKSREWLTELSTLPKLSRQHPPLPPVCTVDAKEEEVCKTTLLSGREDGLFWRQ